MASFMEPVFSQFATLRSASSWFEKYVALSTFFMLLRTAINDLIPYQARSFITSRLKDLLSKGLASDDQVSLEITQHWDGPRPRNHNHLFRAAKQYLPTRITHTYKSLKVGILEDEKNLAVAVDGSQEVVDEFEDIKLTWKLIESPKDKSDSHDKNTSSFILSFDQKHRGKVMDKYLPHVLSTYEAMKAKQRIVKLHKIGLDEWWDGRPLSHPATFETLALDPELKQSIIEDIERFLRRKERYKKVGKPWKRGYLLYGPPGTGKSSLIAAMANYLKFDVYDLELSQVQSNSDLMELMRYTSNRSIVVIEDVDCNREVHARSLDKDSSPGASSNSASDADSQPTQERRRVTLSGLLNSMDGLWSGSEEERIIVFTTNHVERIDPALLRPGRMDKHICLSFCKGKAFRILASNYLDIQGHDPLFEQIEELLEKTEVTPAVVAEQLLRFEDPEVALEELIKFLKERNTESAAQEPAGK